MTRNKQKFEISLFNGKTIFMIWQFIIQDLLVQKGLDLTLKDEKPVVIGEREWT